MNKEEANEIIQTQLDTLKALSFTEVRKYLEKENIVQKEVKSKSGATYFMETHALWEDKGRGHLRVVVAVYDKGWRSIFPITSGFIMGTDGKVIYE